ncbi:class I SAM-dependent RNA methyltransferase [Albimonas sp. CAU 1670]|uniref:THUMP domain-containing class I SAM-dependent RNA methyltransferase n=1 Tax=Albimonas sp. CAU 1670 TaxID=3032599 RepID=UPI0023DC3735|nr:class I SAM-dependent RNA methyltransferase [Albimonas sp. CAU 1670]MDF2235187.1 class I SAM-dependent RNA methyltransferase [Albimonas sp. CAU 1670]
MNAPAPAADPLEIFLAATPGLEPALLAEARAAGFARPRAVPGGVQTEGPWPEAWRANLVLRGASRVLVRFASFRAMHLAQLDKRARKLDWATILRPDVPVKVEATCRKSRIYHAGAAAQRIARAIEEELGAPAAFAGGHGGQAGARDAQGAEVEADAPTEPPLRILARIENDLVTLSLDASGEPLHRRGHKSFVGKAPMRETLAALFLHECGFDPSLPLVDPMCGSGTFVLEAAEIAAGLAPGRSRPFAFERLASFDAEAWAAMKAAAAPDPAPAPARRFHGYDRDDGAIRGAAGNAERAGLAPWTDFRRQAISELAPPEGPPGLVIVNPPYGARIGDKGPLRGLHAALGRVLVERFQGWRVGLVTSEAELARATALPFLPPGPPIPHGGLKVRLHRTDPLR